MIIQPDSNKNIKVWNDVKVDLVAGVTSFSQCITLGDVQNDGDHKLICADINNKLKVFKQECLVSESKLQAAPVAITSFYAQDPNSKSYIPLLAVAGGSYIFIYKNLKGTFKLLIPNIELNGLETTIWEELKESKIEHNQAIEKLKDMLNQKIILSTRSLELLSIKDEYMASNYINDKKILPLIMTNYIVCMSIVKKYNPEDPEGISQIIVGTEGGNIYIIDGTESKIINKFKLKGIPTCIAACGAYESDYRINIACRNEQVYTIRNGELNSGAIQISSKIVNMERLEKALYVATINSYLHSYNPTGKKNWSLKMPSEIICFEQCACYRPRNFKGLLVGLRNSEIRLYNDKLLVNLITIPETIMGFKFGKFGNLAEALVIVTERGSIYVKSMEKSVTIESTSFKKLNLMNDEGTLNIPKKTTLFLDLMEREKELYKSK